MRELRFALRSLARARTYTIVTVLTLGIGFGLAAAVLAIANAYLLSSMPYAGGERLYHVMYEPPGPHEPRGMSEIDWQSLRGIVDATVVSNGAAWYIGDAGSAQLARAARVTQGFIEGLGIRPSQGRVFTAAEYEPGGPEVGLVGHAFWRDRLDGDSAIIGRELRAEPEDRSSAPIYIRVVGVLAPDFWFGRTSDAQTDLITPLRTQSRVYMVRLVQGVPVPYAEQRITEAALRVGSDFPEHWTGVHLESMHARYVQGMRPLLKGINIATAVVLLIACINVAILVLLRSLRRQKEVAVRVALGAARTHLLRMVMSEAALLCAGALALAALFVSVTLKLLAPLIERRLGRPPPVGPGGIQVDSHVLLIMAGLGVLVALVLGLLPLLPRRFQPGATLRRTGFGSDGRALRRLRSGLIGFEMAGALVLLVAGGLMIRSVIDLVRVELGFDAERVARIRIVLPSSYVERPAIAAVLTRMGDEIETRLPGSALSSSFPAFYETQKRTLESDAGLRAEIGGLPVGAHYFNLHGIRVAAGREFTTADRFDSAPVAIVSASLAGELWPDQTAVGHRIRAIEESVPGAVLGPWRTVVGVVSDVRQTYDDHDLRDVYLPFMQVPTRFGNVQVRSAGAHAAYNQLVDLARTLDPYIQVMEPKLLAEEDQQFAQARFLTALLAGFATFATLLAVVGIYGVTTYTVQQRSREVAIRIALGATSGAVQLLFMRESGAVLAGGLAVGILGAAAGTRVIASQIHGVQPFDALTLGAASAILLAAAFGALWRPVRRGANANPLMVLREE